MSETRRILDQIHRAYEGPAWHGPALQATLSGVDYRMASARPIEGGHTIWELVLHIAVWMEVVEQRIGGTEIPTLPAEQDWPAAAEPSESGWLDALSKLAKAQLRLEESVGKLTDERLREIVQGDMPYSIYTMLHGVVHHNLYHAGQIALLKKAAQGRQ